MSQVIRITTRAELAEAHKQQYIQAGYQIEDEQPSIRGMCSFRAVRAFPEDETNSLKDLIWSQAASQKERITRPQKRTNSRSRK